MIYWDEAKDGVRATRDENSNSITQLPVAISRKLICSIIRTVNGDWRPMLDHWLVGLSFVHVEWLFLRNVSAICP